MRWTEHEGHMGKIRNIYSKPSSFIGAIFLKNVSNGETAMLQRQDLTGK
jgi:hypothetical protein